MDHIPGELFESTEQDEQGRVDEHFGLKIGRLDRPDQALLSAREAARTHRPRTWILVDVEVPVGAPLFIQGRIGAEGDEESIDATVWDRKIASQVGFC